MSVRPLMWRGVRSGCYFGGARGSRRVEIKKEKRFLRFTSRKLMIKLIDYLDFVRQLKGLGKKWRRWILGCLSMSNFSLLINGRRGNKL